MSEAFQFGSTVALVYSSSKTHVAPRCFEWVTDHCSCPPFLAVPMSTLKLT
jgi:hypothetical protein